MVGWGGVRSHFHVQPNCSVEVVFCCPWGCDKNEAWPTEVGLTRPQVKLVFILFLIVFPEYPVSYIPGLVGTISIY